MVDVFNTGNTGESEGLTLKDRVICLFKFLKELNNLKQKPVLNIKNYIWSFALKDVPNDPENIRVYWRDRVETETVADAERDGGDTLLSVHKPELQKCPEPGALFKDWLLPGWDDYKKDADVKETVIESGTGKDSKNAQATFADEWIRTVWNQPAQSNKTEETAETGTVIHFTDDAERVRAYNAWAETRKVWIERQELLTQTRGLFTDLYRLYYELRRETETEEIICANGILVDRENPEIKHPVITHRVKLEYDANTDTVFVKDTDVPTELYTVLFGSMGDIHLDGVRSMTDELQLNDYHPLDRNDTPLYLKTLVHRLTSDSIYCEKTAPADWEKNYRLLLYAAPCYIVRKRLDGTLKAIEKIIENIADTGEVPDPIRDIVIGGKVDPPETVADTSVESQLAAVGGESVDILLSKEANKEQLEIANRIQCYNAVLVQGPPGTGKTHTIANLLGHFLAQGKSVLVTSYTAKALSVLKDKLPLGLQHLCVSLLDDSNLDMERSVEGITSYMSKTTAHELKGQMIKLAEEREAVIKKLADVRRNMFAIIKQECDCIVYNGESLSPTVAAKFVTEHIGVLDYIPGKVRLHTALPLTFEELAKLYRSNEGVTAEDEAELANELPNPDRILYSSVYADKLSALQTARQQLEKTAQVNGLQVELNESDRLLTVHGKFGQMAVAYDAEKAIEDLKEYCANFDKIEPWMKAAAVAGKQGGNYRAPWDILIEQIQKTVEYAEAIFAHQIGNTVCFNGAEPNIDLRATYEILHDIFNAKGKIGALTRTFHPGYAAALAAVTVNGQQPQSAHDCMLVLQCIEMDDRRKKCAKLWDDLLAKRGLPAFFELDSDGPENIAKNYIPLINKYLDWYQEAYQPLLRRLSAAGISSHNIFATTSLDSDLVVTDKILTAVDTDIPAICDLMLNAIKIAGYNGDIAKTKSVLLAGKRGSSRVCQALVAAIGENDATAYAAAFAELERMYGKYALQTAREEALKKLEPVAPQWAAAIRAREGVHGNITVPDDIEDAWKWKQLTGIIEEITSKSFSELQEESSRLSKRYREVTAQYAEKSAWYHLLCRTETDLDMCGALQGWAQMVKKIGKGTRKKAAEYKAEARRLMVKCQLAVPAWIMPINRALETLDPKQNRFDILIIDEASQADISALAILYMGKKLIIVGDDNQVSPMAIGVEVDQMSRLQQQYLVDRI